MKLEQYYLSKNIFIKNLPLSVAVIGPVLISFVLRINKVDISIENSLLWVTSVSILVLGLRLILWILKKIVR